MKSTLNFFAKLATPANIRIATLIATLVVAVLASPDATGGI